MDATKANTPQDNLIPLNKAVQDLTEKRINPSTIFRWMTKGLEGLDEQRIRLQVWYIGRQPHTTHAAIRQFLDAVTAARLEKMRRTQQRADDVTPAELKAAGLIGNAKRRS